MFSLSILLCSLIGAPGEIKSAGCTWTYLQQDFDEEAECVQLGKNLFGERIAPEGKPPKSRAALRRTPRVYVSGFSCNRNMKV